MVWIIVMQEAEAITMSQCQVHGARLTDILLYWASKGVDGFRCDMAEMVPTAFWSYATRILKAHYPQYWLLLVRFMILISIATM